MTHLTPHQHNYDLVEITTLSRPSSSSSSFSSFTTHPAPPLPLSPSGPTIDCDQKILIGPMLHNHIHNNSYNTSDHPEQKTAQQGHALTTPSSISSDTHGQYMAPIPGCFPYRANKKRGPHSSMTKSLPNGAFCKSRRGSLSAPCLASLPPLTEKTRAAHFFGQKTTPVITLTPTGASVLANEVLSLIFRHLMDRKSILNCSLVSTHWHGPARLELARIVQDMPFNGQGLVHAIRLVSNLADVYYHSNPETKQVLASEHPPDLLYSLIWTLIFIDQNFRDPRAQSKVTCRYFVRLMQREGAGYPLECFDKRVLKNLYNDIRSRPLLPAPHMIRAQNTELGSNEEQNEGHEDDNDAQAQGPPPHRSRQLSSDSFMNLGSITLNTSFKRISRWWRNAREDSGNEPSSGSTSQFELPSLLSDPVSSEEIVSNTLVPSSQRSLLSSSSTFPQGSTSTGTFSIRSMFGSISNLSINRSEGFASIMLTRGFTAIPYGWHAEGDGLDNVVRFPQATKPSTLGNKFAVLQFADLMVGQEPDE